jgi:choline-sulfatase
VKTDPRPNIVLIVTDQQSAAMMSCAGNPYLRTPAMDSLAASGVRFERAYCTNPVCVPSRFSLMTGRMPSEIGLRSNDSAHIEAVPDHVRKHGLGWLFRRAGYDVAYGGKVHLPKMSAEDIGFDTITSDEREALPDVCSEYILRERDKPFLLVASFINPHDICYMAIRDYAKTDHAKRLVGQGKIEIATLDKALQLPEGVGREAFFEQYCPPLPSNFEPQQDEPEAIRKLQAQRPFKKNARDRYTDEQWRMHRWAYAKLTEMVDAQIGRVCDAVRESGQEGNTVILFSSDHGDMDSAHRMEHKTAFYEEACHIPLIVSQPGTTPAGFVNKTHLVSNGLDLLPTLCDYADIGIPEDLCGLSFRPLAEGKETKLWRTSLPIESELGRMVVADRYKYMLYDEGEHREQLIDLQDDPGEMRNAANNPAYTAILGKQREIFEATWSGSHGRHSKKWSEKMRLGR